MNTSCLFAYLPATPSSQSIVIKQMQEPQILTVFNKNDSLLSVIIVKSGKCKTHFGDK